MDNAITSAVTRETAEQQNAKYAPGTVIVIEGQSTAVENGRFVVQQPFMVQPNGDQYFQWRRIGRNGKGFV
jgi:hypothetical protein